MVTNGDYIMMMIRAQWRLKLLAFFHQVLSLELRKLLPLLLLEVAGPVSWLSLPGLTASANIDMLVKFLIYVDIMWYTYIMYVNDKLHYWWVIFKGLSYCCKCPSWQSGVNVAKRRTWIDVQNNSVQGYPQHLIRILIGLCESDPSWFSSSRLHQLSKSSLLWWNSFSCKAQQGPLEHFGPHCQILNHQNRLTILKTIQNACALLIRPKNSCRLRKSLSQTGVLIWPFCPPDSSYICGIDCLFTEKLEGTLSGPAQLGERLWWGEVYRRCTTTPTSKHTQYQTHPKHQYAGKGFLTIFSLVNFLF